MITKDEAESLEPNADLVALGIRALSFLLAQDQMMLAETIF